MKKLELGLQIHCVRDAFMEDPETTLQQVAAMGYDGVEMVLQYCPFEPERYRKALKETGLACYSMMLDWKYFASEPDMERTIELARAMDCPVIIMAAVPKPTLEEVSNNPTLARELADTARNVAKRLQDAGFETGYHDHDRDHMVFVDGKESFMDYLLRNTDDDYIYMIDTGNAMAGGADPIEKVRKFPHRSPIVHLKGFAAETRYLTPMWKSEIDTDELVKTLVNEGGAEVISIEFGFAADGGDPFDQCARSYTWLRDKLTTNGLL
ncbi:MAG: sugar phosphate isomerase/epimerase [Oscillospiraceae bacterium]|nr:sugar phosphate isomerase/epimerase [Oscillospiraceae bacterium]